MPFTFEKIPSLPPSIVKLGIGSSIFVVSNGIVAETLVLALDLAVVSAVFGLGGIGLRAAAFFLAASMFLLIMSFAGFLFSAGISSLASLFS
jgi:hypothetical protein